MKKIKQLWFLSLGTMLVIFLMVPLIGLAQETPSTVNEETSTQELEPIVVADVNIYNAKLDSQAKHQLTISFQLSNGKKVQPDVQYAVFLTKKDKGGNQVVVGRKVYPEVVNLGENQKVNKVIKYTAPVYVDGEYTLWIEAANNVGMSYANAYVGEVKFQKEKEFIEIQPESCFLTIGEEEKKYTLEQGVNIKPTEDITVHCTLSNHFNQDKVVTPKIVTRLRSPYGKILNTQELSQKISIKANQDQNVSLLIPKVTNPQAYDTTLTFIENKQLISNSITLHYVIAGESATIQNVSLDKPTYQKGEIAKLSFFWSGRADRFTDARYLEDAQILKTPQVTIAISDQNGNSCNKLFIQKLNSKLEKAEDVNPTFNIPINQKCVGARVKVSILDSQGKVLAQREFHSPQQKIQKKKVQKTNNPISQKTSNSTNNLAKSILLWIIFLGVAIGIIAIVIKYAKDKNSTGMKSLLFLVALLGGMFLMGNGVEAKTFSVSKCHRNHHQRICHVRTYSVNLNKSIYAPGETATLTGSTVTHYDNAKLYGKIENNKWQIIFSHHGMAHKGWNSGKWSGSSYGHITGRVPNTPGVYNAQARGYAASNSKAVNLPYIVACADTSWSPATNTVCSGTSFPQTSNCGHTRTVTGTKLPTYSPQCVYTPTGKSCSDVNNCGKTPPTQTNTHKNTPTNNHPPTHKNPNAHNPTCADTTEARPACYHPWKEVAP